MRPAAWRLDIPHYLNYQMVDRLQWSMTKEIVLAILSHAPHQEAFLPGIGRLSELQKRNVEYWMCVSPAPLRGLIWRESLGSGLTNSNSARNEQVYKAVVCRASRSFCIEP